MAKAGGIVRLRGRFKAGSKVALVQVAHEGVLRSEGGRTVSRKKVDEDGSVTFDEGVEVGGRYFIVGQIDGEPVEVRARGNEPDHAEDLLVNSAVVPERQKLADGRWQDELVHPNAVRQGQKAVSVEEPQEREEEAPKRRSSSSTSSAKRPATRKPAAKSSTAKKTTTAKPAARSARKEK